MSLVNKKMGRLWIFFVLLNLVQWNIGSVDSRSNTNIQIQDDIALYLSSIRLEIMNYMTQIGVGVDDFNPFPFADDQGNAERFMNKYWANFSSDSNIPVMVIIVDYNMKQIGNMLGLYMSQVACGELAGAHEIVIDIQDFRKGEVLRKSNKRRGVIGGIFFDESRPPIYVNPSPAINMDTAILNFQHGECILYKKQIAKLNPKMVCCPWLTFFPITKMVPSYRRIVKPAMDRAMDHLFRLNKLNTTLFFPEKLIVTEGRPAEPHGMIDKPLLAPVAGLPLWPDVTIHVRCSDNVAYLRMGLTPFRFILSSIPTNAKYIFIASEASENTKNYHLCGPILQELHSLVIKQHPTAYVVLRTGGNDVSMFIALAMFINSQTIICSASTFCLHFAISRSTGKAILPNNRGVFYSQIINCCGTIETIPNSYTISDWRLPNGFRCVKCISK